MTVSLGDCQNITARLNNLLNPLGFEIYPFQVGWYNEQVEEPFRFKLPDSTLCYTVVSTPDMFEQSLIPFMCNTELNGHPSNMDILDRCMQSLFDQVKRSFPDDNVQGIHDFELSATRRPKILVQPASHVSGAAFYYTRACLDPDPFPANKKIFGVCIHPQYGGWFALRGVLIFESVQCPDLPFTPPQDCVPDNDKKVQLLDLFNFHWRDARYRDVVKSIKKYSEDQQNYFNTLPKDRVPLVRSLKSKFMAAGDSETTFRASGDSDLGQKNCHIFVS